MIRTMCMDTLEWDQQECIELQAVQPVLRPVEERRLPPDLTDADIDAFLHRMYALQQC